MSQRDDVLSDCLTAVMHSDIESGGGVRIKLYTDSREVYDQVGPHGLLWQADADSRQHAGAGMGRQIVEILRALPLGSVELVHYKSHMPPDMRSADSRRLSALIEIADRLAKAAREAHSNSLVEFDRNKRGQLRVMRAGRR
jgi:hypothetical protein